MKKFSILLSTILVLGLSIGFSISAKAQLSEMSAMVDTSGYDFVITVPVDTHNIASGVDMLRVKCYAKSGTSSASEEIGSGNSAHVTVPAERSYSGSITVAFNANEDREAAAADFVKCGIRLHSSSTDQWLITGAHDSSVDDWRKALEETPYTGSLTTYF